MKRSATRAATIENALSQPNRRSDGSSENTVTTRPQASTTVVRISAGPTSTVARSTASSGLMPGFCSSRSRLRKWIVAERPRPNDTVSATTLANCSPSPMIASTVPDATTGKMPGRMQENITTTERNASPMKTATSRNSTVRPRLSFSIMLELLRAAITERPVTAIS